MKSGPLRTLYLTLAVLVLLAIVCSPVFTIWMIRAEAARIVSDPLQGLATSSLATMQASEGFLETARSVDGNGLPADDLKAMLEKSSGIVDSQYATHQETLKTDEERAIFARLNELKEDYRATRRQVVTLLAEGKMGDANKLFDTECVPKFHAYAGSLGDLVKHNAEESRNGGAEIIRLCHILLVVQGLLLVFFFVYGFFVPFTAVLERLSRNPIEIRN